MKVVFIFFGFILLAASTPVEKWHKSSDGSTYFIDIENKFNWFEAWNECARKNMSLIAFDTSYKHQQIDQLIRKLFPTCPAVWIAGHDNAVDKRYEWATTGEIFTFTNWGPGQPDLTGAGLGPEHCALIWHNTWQWYDLPCTYKLGFICEEQQLVKQKSQEMDELKKTCSGNESYKYKNVIFYVNPK